MSQQNVELARRFYDCVNRRDLNAWLAMTDAQAELISILIAVEGGYHGHAGFRRWWENVFDHFPDYTIEVGEVRDLGVPSRQGHPGGVVPHRGRRSRSRGAVGVGRAPYRSTAARASALVA